jgi:hypothetical protein
LKTEESSLYRQPMSDLEWQGIMKNFRNRFALIDQEPFQSCAEQIREALQWLDPVMTKYAEITCPQCKDPCCTAHAIFFNQTDMLSLVAMGISLPPGQTRVRPGAPCRYLTPNGCRLQRIARPYVCVWFLCEAQMDLFWEERALTQRHFVKQFEKIRLNRLRLEALYENLS